MYVIFVAAIRKRCATDVVYAATPAHLYLAAQLDYIHLLRDMSLGCFQLLTNPYKFDPVRRWTNYTVRYKWMLAKGYANIETPDPFFPSFDTYLKDERVLLRKDPVRFTSLFSSISFQY